MSTPSLSELVEGSSIGRLVRGRQDACATDGLGGSIVFQASSFKLRSRMMEF
ncbi:MAG: hypothetical protein HC769_13765 [Cyanobacteria bacterium CRU_2_1]|nr:hypothetical protein [Cyanobacteria bacterium RU_5_0]NJR59807.1 hypothetical protein [Cyanobacteria bacterium CRU_2_1]